MTTWDPDVLARLKSDAVRLDLFLYVGSSPEIRAWTGVGDFIGAANNIDFHGGVYKGVGEIADMPVINQLINGTAERIDLTLSGVEPAILDLADGEAAGLRNKTAAFGIVVFDDDYQPIAPVTWLWVGRCDSPRVSRVGGRRGEPSVRQVSISLGSMLTGRERPVLSFFTGIDQRRRSSDDAFCDNANLYSSNATIQWPI